MKRVLLGMSGGVDSSVSALLLQKMGYEVVGATMILFEDPNIEVGCLSNSAVLDAKKVCAKLNIEHHVINLKDDFKNYVINNFIDSYKKGFTPNPCVECNKYLKFGKLYEEALKLNCDYIATIPMNGKINSLNASVAAGIVIYEAIKNRGINEL